jgi:hypothetical protein
MTVILVGKLDDYPRFGGVCAALLLPFFVGAAHTPLHKETSVPAACIGYATSRLNSWTGNYLNRLFNRLVAYPLHAAGTLVSLWSGVCAAPTKMAIISATSIGMEL